MSDADLLAVLSRRSVRSADTLHSPRTVMEKLRRTLGARFRHTHVRRDGQAVVVDFGDGSHPVDVVPAIWESQSGFRNYPIHIIPDGRGWWMRASPASHNRYLRLADRRAGGQLKYAARIFKFWRATRATAVPISGFHVELLLAFERLCEGPRAYSTIMRDLLVLLARRRCAALNDPVGISGRIRAAQTEAKRQAASRTLLEAAKHADRAITAEDAGDVSDAWRQWNIVFNGSFPR